MNRIKYFVLVGYLFRTLAWRKIVSIFRVDLCLLRYNPHDRKKSKVKDAEYVSLRFMQTFWVETDSLPDILFQTILHEIAVSANQERTQINGPTFL